MSLRSILVVPSAIVLSLTLMSCLSGRPQRIVRPQIDASPWAEKTVRSAQTGQEYEYMHLPGPTESSGTILLIHGGFIDNRIWLYAHDLSAHFEVIAPRWPDSSPLYTGRVEDYGEMAYDLLQTLEIDDLYIAGISAGGWAAVDLASRKEDLNVRALFLISTSMFGATEDESRSRVRNARTALRVSPDRMRALVEFLGERSEHDPAPGEVQLHDVFYVRPYTYYEQLFSLALNQGERRQATDRIRCPVLVLHGTADETIDVELAEHTEELFADSEFVRLDDYGHSMVFSHGPEIVQIMLNFLDQRETASPEDG